MLLVNQIYIDFDYRTIRMNKNLDVNRMAMCMMQLENRIRIPVCVAAKLNINVVKSARVFTSCVLRNCDPSS